MKDERKRMIELAGLNEIRFDKTKIHRFAKADKFIEAQLQLYQNKRYPNPEELVFNTWILGDTTMERAYTLS